MNKLLDINKVCEMFGTTSRTLRFYEAKGIIESTKDSFSARRKYSTSQVERIRNVLVLRTLGISIKTISELQNNDSDLKSAVISRKAEIYASLESKIKEINLLNEAIEVLESGKDIFCDAFGQSTPQAVKQYLDISIKCVDAILNDNYETLTQYCSRKVVEYMPESAFRAMWNDTVLHVGKFVRLDKLIPDEKYPNIVYQYIQYEKMGIKIKFVFNDGKVSGLWTTYYELEKR